MRKLTNPQRMSLASMATLLDAAKHLDRCYEEKDLGRQQKYIFDAFKSIAADVFPQKYAVRFVDRVFQAGPFGLNMIDEYEEAVRAVDTEEYQENLGIAIRIAETNVGRGETPFDHRCYVTLVSDNDVHITLVDNDGDEHDFGYHTVESVLSLCGVLIPEKPDHL